MYAGSGEQSADSTEVRKGATTAKKPKDHQRVAHLQISRSHLVCSDALPSVAAPLTQNSFRSLLACLQDVIRVALFFLNLSPARVVSLPLSPKSGNELINTNVVLSSRHSLLQRRMHGGSLSLSCMPYVASVKACITLLHTYALSFPE